MKPGYHHERAFLLPKLALDWFTVLFDYELTWFYFFKRKKKA